MVNFPTYAKSAAYYFIKGYFPSATSVTIALTNDSDDGAVTMSGTGATQIGTTEAWKWSTANIATQPTTFAQYTLISTPNIGETQRNNFALGGPADIPYDVYALVSGLGLSNACTSALNTYDPPTKGEMDTGFSTLNNLSSAQAVTACSDAISGAALATLGSVSALNNLSSAQATTACQNAISGSGVSTLVAADISTGCTSSLNSYDPPTYSEMNSGFAGISSITLADVQSGCGMALTDYDPPTKTEMDSGFSGLNDLSSAEAATACSDALSGAGITTAGFTTACDASLASYDGPTYSEMTSAFTALNDLSPAEAETACSNAISGAGIDLTAADVRTECDAALAAYDAPTHTEMTNELGALNNISKADAQAATESGLSAYGAAKTADVQTTTYASS